MFQMLAFKNGACLKDNTKLVSIKKDGDQGLKVAASNGENFWGKKYVVVVGDWMRNLVKTVCGIELPIQPLEANVCYWRIKDGHEVEYAIGNNFRCSLAMDIRTFLAHYHWSTRDLLK
ncbi:hypothetical protein Gohar_002674 [Gossypium harknessii]|uniref:Uncharacterized protein n=1 Tax=Gossypium harknessii TaxID=34285 RepID=A0A7J9HLL0_9ROSI|nr:hypothetical protein [Gossypium harknessii]